MSTAEPLRGRELTASLTVGSLEESLRWYHEVVGFEIAQRHEREGGLVAVSLRAGDVRILLARDDGTRGGDRVKGEGFSLMITTEQSVDAIADRIRDGGWALESEPFDTPWGMRAFRVKDPDGFRFTISSERRSPP